MADETYDIRDYILNARGISRRALNIMAFIGLFIFGWLITVPFDNMRKGGLGWMYGILTMSIFIVGIRLYPPSWFLGMAIYFIAWIHANRVLSHYESIARKRISEIDNYSQPSINTILEKGMLLHKVLGKKESAVDVLTGTLQMPNGDPYLLNAAGVVMFGNKRYNEAAILFNRASVSTTDKALLNKITQNLALPKVKSAQLAVIPPPPTSQVLPPLPPPPPPPANEEQQQLTLSMYCSKCGNELKPENKFCPVCGSRKFR